MTVEEIRKKIYKQKPNARFVKIRKGMAYYRSEVVDVDSGDGIFGDLPVHKLWGIIFEVPVSDMGDADFNADMEARLLTRWILEFKIKSPI